MSRLTFGIGPEDIATFNALGSTNSSRLQAWVDRQLDPANIDDSECEARIATLQLTTLDKSLEQLWGEYQLGSGDDVVLSEQPAREVRMMIWTRAVYSQRQLFEVITAFWRNHFNVYGWIRPIRSVLPHYERDVIRAYALGNFREFLEAVSKSPAMLSYLNNDVNQAGGPNENYGRELFELYGMGAENYLGVQDPNSVAKDRNNNPIGYVDNDVYEGARCFTGWRISNSFSDPEIGNLGSFYYHRPWHDRFNKMVLGKYLAADQPDLKDGQDVLDLIAFHPATSRFIARKLCRYLIGDNPSSKVVEAAARTFREKQNAPDQLRAVVRTILLHSSFKKTWADKLRDPFRVATAMLRAIRADWTYSETFTRFFDGMGMPVYGRRSPDGYPDVKEAWQGTTSMLYRWRMCNALIEQNIPEVSFDLVGQMPGNVSTPNKIADFWIKRLLGRAMHPAENRAAIVDFLAQGTNPDYALTAGQIEDRVPRAVALIMMAPDFQLS